MGHTLWLSLSTAGYQVGPSVRCVSQVIVTVMYVPLDGEGLLWEGPPRFLPVLGILGIPDSSLCTPKLGCGSKAVEREGPQRLKLIITPFHHQG